LVVLKWEASASGLKTIKQAPSSSRELFNYFVAGTFIEAYMLMSMKLQCTH